MNPEIALGKITSILTVKDVLRPFEIKLPPNQPIADSYDKVMEFCIDNDLDPMDQIAIVEENGKKLAWIAFEDMITDKSVRECMQPFRSDIIISSNTSIIDAIKIFCTNDEGTYFILEGKELIGYIFYVDFHKPPVRLALFASLLNLEELMLKIIKINARSSIRLLPQKRIEKAIEIYKLRRYKLNEEGKPYNSSLLDCTAMIDKFIIIRKLPQVVERFPYLSNKNMQKKAERLRNEIAHPSEIEQSSVILTKKDLWQFINWLDESIKELDKFLEDTSECYKVIT